MSEDQEIEIRDLRKELRDTEDLLQEQYEIAANLRKELTCNDPCCARTTEYGDCAGGHWWGDSLCSHRLGRK